MSTLASLYLPVLFETAAAPGVEWAAIGGGFASATAAGAAGPANQAPPAYVAAGAGAAVTGSPIAIDYPAGITAGDLLLLQITTRATTVTVDTPAGWTLLATVPAAYLLAARDRRGDRQPVGLLFHV